MQAIATLPDPQDAVPERRPAAILIGELRNFTRMSEMLQPERVLELAGDFFTLLARIVTAQGGWPIDTHNDSLMAAFDPGAGGNEVGAALRAAQEMQTEFGILAERWQHDYGLQTAIAVGLHLGETVFGAVGHDAARRFTAFGDTVSIAERLVHRARAGEFVYSETVKRAADFTGVQLVSEVLPPLELARRPAIKLYGILLDTRLDFT